MLHFKMNNIHGTSLLLLSLLIILNSIWIVQSQSPVLTQNPCSTKTVCRDCIQTPGCAWCNQIENYGKQPRCFNPSLSNRNTECHADFIINPDSAEWMISVRNLSRADSSTMYASAYEEYMEMSSYNWKLSMRNESSSWEEGSSSSSSGSGSSSSSFGQITQVYPQNLNLKLRMNEKYSIKMFYAQARDYPVDLYYLMDLSKSMEDDKKKLSKLGYLLTETMQNITSNFRLGFGSFVDKVLMPYVSTVPKKLLQPCDGCEAPYGYRNHMPLSQESNKFSEEVNRANVSGNLDAPEGGFDAIMQAAVCTEQIGWRQQARHVLVFSTDAGFHYAGDGKLGGVITPNDGACHLAPNGMYTHSTLLDYPSISQINWKVKEKSINIIFAVTAQQQDVYQKLSSHIEGSSCATLDEDSSNIVDLVRDEYKKISSSVEMTDTSAANIQVTYYSKCLGTDLIETKKCDGLKVGDVVSFSVEITVTSCPKNPADWKTSFEIRPIALNESLRVNLEMLCDCPCEHEGFEVNSPVCHGQGILKCGICECDKNFLGHNCECSITDAHKDNDLSKGCRPQNDTSLEDCSGRGTCSCGACYCNKREYLSEIISGQYCECDNFSCERFNDLVCSGTANGDCVCGTCQCKPGWSGSACQCRTSNDSCMNKATGKLCSGHGNCVCGECVCDSAEEGRWSGLVCEKCPTCAGRCTEFKDCVQCQVYKTGPLSEEDCKANCTLFEATPEADLEVREDIGEHLCTFYDDDDCRYQFTYTDTEPDVVIVRAKKDRDCPPKVFIIGIVLAVIAAIVLIGLAILLLWKLLTTIHDRREFARFEKERMMAKWDTGENPIYKQATSTFKNPTYAGK